MPMPLHMDRCALKRFHKAARWFAIGINPFLQLGDVLRVGTWSKYIKNAPPELLSTDLLEIREDLQKIPQ